MNPETRNAEEQRLREEAERKPGANWKRWGPYLSERQWATVREDYSANGDSWGSFPHDHARSRAYRWGEDGLLGISDRQGRLCFGLAMWNGRDPILKERLFGLTGPEGNHGEDVKECYYYLESTPTHSYAKGLYKYPQAEFPYEGLVVENRKRGLKDLEAELVDLGVFDDGRYFDLTVEYAKASPEDICIRISVANRGPERARLHLLPTLWFRNTWSWDPDGERPEIRIDGGGAFVARHSGLGTFRLTWDGEAEAILFTENETNTERIWGSPNRCRWVKDAFHRYLVHGETGAVNPDRTGTKAAPLFVLDCDPEGCRTVNLRLRRTDLEAGCEGDDDPDAVFAKRIQEMDAFYQNVLPAGLSVAETEISRQAYAGLLWTKQFYHYVVRDWLRGDPGQVPPPVERFNGRNRNWEHVHCNDILSMPDKWEYPWFAAWDTAFHMIPMAEIDPQFAKDQLILFLREWYLHPNGQIPAYEFVFKDVNPPVHAWAVWKVYRMGAKKGGGDRRFLESCFQKLLLNFTWWVNRKDADGNNLFEGGFLGLDNIGVFDRSKPLPTGGYLQQADGTAWMAFYSLTMLAIALELAQENPVYEDMASKFFEHFVQIADAMNHHGGTGLWDDRDGFYYDHLRLHGETIPLKTRSLVGLLPLVAVEVLDQTQLDRLPEFSRRMRWFIEHRADVGESTSLCETCVSGGQRLLAIPTRERLERTLGYLLDEAEFLSDYGIRSLSRVHAAHPYVFHVDGQAHRVAYTPAESDSHLFGGNSNWRGPIWFPINFLILEALDRYHDFYGDDFKVECPRGSGHWMNLREVSRELARRHATIFLPEADGRRPCHGGDLRYRDDPDWRSLVLFYEYFDGDTGRGCGASHQTGWTSLVTNCIAKSRGLPRSV